MWINSWIYISSRFVKIKIVYKKPFKSIWYVLVILYHSGNKSGTATVLKKYKQSREKIHMRIENVVKKGIKHMETKSPDNQVYKKRNNTRRNRHLLIKGRCKEMAFED